MNDGNSKGLWLVRIALCVIFAFCLAGLLAGCGGGGDDGEDEHVGTPVTACAASSAACK